MYVKAQDTQPTTQPAAPQVYILQRDVDSGDADLARVQAHLVSPEALDGIKERLARIERELRKPAMQQVEWRDLAKVKYIGEDRAKDILEMYPGLARPDAAATQPSEQR